MDNKYITLFKELAQSAAASAEAVMDYDRKLKDEEGLKTATQMRDDYQDLADKISAAGNDYALTKNDAAKLAAAAMIMVNQLQDRITFYKRSIAGCQTDLIPKLQELLASELADDAFGNLANEKFILENNN